MLGSRSGIGSRARRRSERTRSRVVASLPTREGNAVWLHLADKDRPAVVVELREHLVRAAYGTHEERRGWDAAPVRRETRAGKRWPLVDPLTGSNTAWERPPLLRRAQGDCLDDLFDEIRRLVAEHDARVRNDEPEAER